MNNLTILTIIFSTVAYCAARNCNKTLTDAELYTTAINVSCSDELNRFTNISSYLVNYLADINDGNFTLKFQVIVTMPTAICISSCICILFTCRQMLLIITAQLII